MLSESSHWAIPCVSTIRSKTTNTVPFSFVVRKCHNVNGKPAQLQQQLSDQRIVSTNRDVRTLPLSSVERLYGKGFEGNVFGIRRGAVRNWMERTNGN